LWVVCAAATTWAVIFWLPAGGGPEQMVVPVKDVCLGNMGLGEHKVTLAKGTVTRAGAVLAEFVVIFLAVFVTDEFTDASVAVRFSGTALTVFVGFADGV